MTCSFVLLSYMNTEYFPDICKSVHCPNNNSKINIDPENGPAWTALGHCYLLVEDL